MAFRYKIPGVLAAVAAVVTCSFSGALAGAQAAPACCRADTVRAIAAPTHPLPTEALSSGQHRFSFIAYGDTRGRRDGVAEQVEHGIVVDAMLRAIREREGTPDAVKFVLQSGDAVVDGRDASQWNVSFIGLINRVTTLGGVPYFLAPGNHDVTTAAALASPGRQEGLQNYLRAMGQLIPPDNATRRLNGYPTYAFGYGNTFVLAFDSNIAGDSTQYDWVSSQLAQLDRTRYPHVVVFFHHPPLSSGPHGGPVVERPSEAVRQFYMPLFRKYKVGLLLTGHEHLFEHWIERYRDASGQWQRMDQIVSGGGGAPIYTYAGQPDLGRYRSTSGGRGVKLKQLVRPGSRQRDNPYHFLVVTVNGAQMSVEYVGVDWGAKHRPYKRPHESLVDPAPRRSPATTPR